MPGTRTASVVHDSAGRPTALRMPSFSLRVIQGPDLRRERRFATDRVLIGTGEGAHYPLTDPTVSAVHCEVLLDNWGHRIRDLGAKNGVYLRDRRVLEAWLEDKDELRFGDTAVRFQLLDDTDDQPLASANHFGRLRGSSLRMRELFAQLAKAAQSPATVLLQGETGTGKELAAEALVSEGPRREQPFVTVDCASLVGSLAESELFGHERHAFTGADSEHAGAFERAHGGTLFLDEVGELPLELQPKLLGVLERRSVQRVGGQRAVPVDVRVIAATHRDLTREVNRGAFRADLYYRLAVVEIRLPSLREHPEDVPELIDAMFQEIPGAGALSPGIFERLCSQDYPGNVRQLRNAVERFALGLELDPPPSPVAAIDLDTPFRVQKERVLGGFERAYLARLIERARGNITEAARLSGLSRVRLYQMLHRWQLMPR
jgi:two-component system response regulator GlrR